jgi:hypothetical protein
MASADIVVNVLTKLQDSGVKSAEQKFGKFGGAMKKAMVPAIAATGVIVAFGVSAVNSASRLEQAMGGVKAVFGDNSTTIEKWASQSAKSIGLAKSEYGELATLIGSQLKNAGLPMDEVTKKTGALITKGADLAAMYGGTTAEAVEALSSALKGEFDPMDKYGGSLSAAKIAAEQAAQGTDKLTGKAADQAKAMATLSLINKQTADSQGKAAAESDSMAAKTQQATAQYEDMKATLGTALLPAMSTLMGYLAKLVTWMGKNTTVVYVIVGALLALAAAVIVVNVAMLILSANPIVLIIAAVVAVVILLGVAFYMAYQRSETFRKVVQAVFAVVTSSAKAFLSAAKAVFTGVWNAGRASVNAIRSAWNSMFSAVRSLALTFTTALRNAFNTVRNAASTTVSSIRSAFTNMWTTVRTAAQNAFSKVSGYIAAVKTTAVTLKNYITDKLATCWDAVKTAADRALSPVTTAINAIKTAISNVITKVGDLISALGRIKVPKISLPKIPGLGKSAPAVATAPAGMLGASPRVARPTRAAASSGGSVVNINVTGAVDPEATARQIRRILEGHNRRGGLAS